MSRPPRRSASTPSPDYSRLAERFDQGLLDIAGRIEGLADRFDKRLGRIERDLGAGEQRDAAFRSELDEAKLAAGELRDGIAAVREELTNLKAEQPAVVASSAAQGAAEGAVRGAAASGRIAAAEIAKGFWATLIGKVSAVCVLVAAIAGAINALPTIIRWTGSLLAHLAAWGAAS